MRSRKRATFVASGVGIAAVALASWGGVALAVSVGGYNPAQQDCSPNSDAYNTVGTQYGCHNVAINVEGGGTTDGNPNPDNTRYVEYGGNELPQTTEPATPTILGIGYPGQQNAEHSGCLAADTNGTGGGTGTGCGTGTGGLGFSTTYNYYNTLQPGYMYIPVPDPTDFFFGPTGFFGPLMIPVPDPTATNVSGKSPVTQPKTDTNGPGSFFGTALTDGLIVYFGMDDNTDAGEHDGVTGGKHTGTNGAFNGPSDGGGMLLVFNPQWVTHPTKAGSATNPEGAANYSMGACADGICTETTTQQQTVYYGCGANKRVTPKGGKQDCTQSGNVYDYSQNPTAIEDPNCNSGNISTETCNPSMNKDRANTPSKMNAEPGVQVYGDPDPQRSPAVGGTPLWPTPGVYVGTCGAYAGSPYFASTTNNLPAGSTNGSGGQVALDPNPSVC